MSPGPAMAIRARASRRDSHKPGGAVGGRRASRKRVPARAKMLRPPVAVGRERRNIGPRHTEARKTRQRAIAERAINGRRKEHRHAMTSAPPTAAPAAIARPVGREQNHRSS